MSTVKVVDVISRALTLLKDTSTTRWTGLELQNWLNDSYREIVNLHPDANTLTGVYTCVAGYRQDIQNTYPNSHRLLEVLSNQGNTSTYRGVRLINRRTLDDQRPGWYNEDSSVNIQLYMYDSRVPKEFLVYPPATVDAALEVIYVEVPTPHTLTESQLLNPATTETIKLDIIYANPMLDYILYRAYSKDSDNSGSAARAVAHYQAFVTSLQYKVHSDEQINPGTA